MNKYSVYEDQEIHDSLRTEITQFNDEQDLIYRLKEAKNKNTTIYAYTYSVDDVKGIAYLEFLEGSNIEGYIEREDITYPQGRNSKIHQGRVIACLDNIVPVKVIDIEPENDGIIKVRCSRRLAIEEIRDKYNEDIKNNKLTENMIVKGIITGMDNSRVFVNLGGDVEGILGVADISKAYVKDPSDVLNIGDTLELCIKRIRPQTETEPMHISLSRSMLLDGWAEIDKNKRIREGRIVPGIIKNKILQGIFVELNESFEGLADFSNLSNDYNYGDRVKVKILKIDKKRQKIKLRIIENQ